MKDRADIVHTLTRLTSRLAVKTLFVALLCATPFHAAMAQTAPNLGAAANFAVLAGTTVTCTGGIINGDVGVNLGGSVGACTVNGTIHTGDALAVQAYGDFLTAYGVLAGVACTATVPGTLAGLTLAPGVYCLDPSAKTGLLTLSGPADGIWIFKTESSAFTASSFQVVFAGGAAACSGGGRVFWWSSAGATLTDSDFMGTVLAGTSATVTNGTFSGQLLAESSVTLTTPATFDLCAANPPPTPCPTIVLAPTTLPNQTVGVPYSQTISATGGTGPYSFAVTSGTLPPGLTLSSAGVLSGTPTTAGSTSFTVTATDAATCTGSNAYVMVVNPPGCPTILLQPSSLPNATVGQTYNVTITASGGTAPYTFAISAGTLPSGLTLTNVGVLSGVPMIQGNYAFSVTATDNHIPGCTGIQMYTLVVGCPAITLSPASLPQATVGMAYSQTVVANGGAGPYSYAITSGSLPPGITLSSGGLLSGVPTVAGTSTFIVTAVDVDGCVGNRAYSLVIGACPTIVLSPSSLAGGTSGLPYSQTITASGGTGPYTFAVTSGDLPAGLTLSSSGTLSGTPRTPGIYNFTVTATEANGCTGSWAYSLVIACPAIAVSSISPHIGTAGLAYSDTFTAGGGTGPYTFTVTSGNLPSGLALSSGGILSGITTTAGTYNFTVTATDANGCAGYQAFSIVVVNGPVIIHIRTTPDCTPFKLIVTGSNLQPGIKVYIDGVQWYYVAWKNTGKIVLKGPIHAAVHGGIPHTFTFVNPDGGEASRSWRYVRSPEDCR